VHVIPRRMIPGNRPLSEAKANKVHAFPAARMDVRSALLGKCA
jgi:hypothetical protein